MGTYSLNVPVVPAVRRIVDRLDPELTPFASIRERPTLVVKRFDGDRTRGEVAAIARRVARTAAPFDLRVTGVETFTDPPTGAAPVVYLAVESRGLRRLHDRLVDVAGRVSGLEGDDYVPHVTLARGVRESVGDDVDRVETAIRRLHERDVEVAWTADTLGVWSREYREIVTPVPLDSRN